MVDHTRNFNKRNKKWRMKNDDNNIMVMTTINIEIEVVE